MTKIERERSLAVLLEDADNLALVDIERNPKSGTYMVTGFSGERDRKNNRGGPVDPSNPALPPGTNARRDRGVRPGRRH
jgi:hypothetical protein